MKGGGHESLYDVPLINGCDILVCATPFCLLRMIGHNRTNLERLEYMVIDEAHLVLEKFPQQMRVLMSRYHDLLMVNEKQSIAQFILFSSLWSTKLKTFIDAYLLDRVIITTNKLEASYFGQTQHAVEECVTKEEKITKCLDLIKNISHIRKNTIVFTNKSDSAVCLHDYMKHKLMLPNVSLALEHTNVLNMREIEKQWSLSQEWQILICEDSVSKYLDIDNAQCIIHFDFPVSRSSFGNRLWFMRRHFTVVKKVFKEDRDLRTTLMQKKNQTAANTSTPIESKVASFDNIKDLNNNTDTDLLEAGIEKPDELDDFNLTIKNELQLIERDEDRLCSFIFFTKEDKHYSEGLLNFLSRIGNERKYLPSNLIKLAEKRQIKNELIKKNFLLCPHIKSYGKCMNEIPSSCIYRHKFDPIVDKIQNLDADLTIPDEGLIKVNSCILLMKLRWFKFEL